MISFVRRPWRAGAAGSGGRTICCAGLLSAVLALPAVAQTVPGLPRDLDFDRFVSSLDLEDKRFTFVYKRGHNDGSSVGFHITQFDSRKIGSFVPLNSSSYPEPEVVSYRLARFLGVSDLYNPVSYYKLGPQAASRFKTMLDRHGENDPDRQRNRHSVLAELKQHPASLSGIYRYRPKGKYYRVFALGIQGKLNTSHPLAAFIRANGPMPGDKLIGFPGVKGARPGYPVPTEKESEVARQLSTILLVDQLMGQWDRFWKNLEAAGDETGRLRLLSRDNGGAHIQDGWEFHPLYDQWVSRYDRDVIAKLRALHAFLNGDAPSFAGYTSNEAWRKAAGFELDESFTTFERKLGLLLDKKLPELEKRHGDRVYFAPRGVAAPAADVNRPARAGAARRVGIDAGAAQTR